MLIRALIVLLIVLNLGVAAWWIAAGAPAHTKAPLVQPTDVPRLLLVREGAGAPASTQRPADVAVAPGPVATASLRCFSLGPFDAEAAARTAVERLRGTVSLARPRQAPARGASAYNVFLPPAPDRAQALVEAARVGAAGFDDFLVVNTGELVNAVALGRYGSLEVAQRRQAALQAAGFAAQVSAVGARMPPQWWLDVRAPTGFSAQQAQAVAGSAEARELDCSVLL